MTAIVAKLEPSVFRVFGVINASARITTHDQGRRVCCYNFSISI